MQILDVKTHSEPALTPSTPAFGEHSAERNSRFDEALGSEQERRNLDDKGQARAAKLAEEPGKIESKSSDPNIKTGAAVVEITTPHDSEDESENDWHDFLQSVYDHRENKELKDNIGDSVADDKNNDKDGDTKVTLVIDQDYLKTEQGLVPNNATQLTKAESEDALALLAKLGITLTPEEEQSLLDGGELTSSLVNKIKEFLSAEGNTNTGDAAAVALYVQAAQLVEHTKIVSPNVLDGEVIKQDVSLLSELSDKEQAELEVALDAFTKGDSAVLTDWLTKQNLPAELLQPLTDLVNKSANALTMLTQAELDKGVATHMKAGLAEVLTAAVSIHANSQNMSPQHKEQSHKLTQTIEQLVQRLGSSATVESAPQIGQPQENKVLAALSSTAQELRVLLQESMRNDPRVDNRDVQLGRSFEQLLTTSVASEAPKNITASVATVAQQAPPSHANTALQAARSVPTPGQLAETPFELARQNQQYIDLFGPQAPAQLKDQIAVMFNNRNQFAEMRLDPPELGRLNIRLQMNGEQQASVTFHVYSPQAREAIEHAMPRLREMLEEQGIQLTDSNVREETSQLAEQNQQQGSKGSNSTGSSARSDADLVEEEQISTTTMDLPDGRIDYYV